MQKSPDHERCIHPLVAKVLQELREPSPGRVPSDPEQPRHGCLKELKRMREQSEHSLQSSQQAKEQLFKLLKLDNEALHPVARVKVPLELPKNSSILKRRASAKSAQEGN